MIERALCPVLIDRDEPRSDLEDALLEARRGHGRVALLAAEAGMGKTRLCLDFRGTARRAGFTVLWGSCSESSLALPYLPFVEALGNHLGSVDLDAVRRRLGHAAAELGQLFPQLHDPSLRVDDSEPAQAKLRLYESVMAFLEMLSEPDGVVLVLEDLHWADASTLEMFDYLSRRIGGSQVLVVANYRTDEVKRDHQLASLVRSWKRSGVASVIELEPLREGDVANMVQAIFNADVNRTLGPQLFARSEGNPFVVEETIKESLDQGDIFRQGSQWTGKEVGDFAVPESVVDTILARIGRLQPEQLDIIRTASIMGQGFDVATLVALADRPAPEVRDALRVALSEQLISEDGDQPGRFRFRHALTREAVYQDMMRPDREALHARAAEVLVDVRQVSAAERAHHLLAAGRWGDAVPVCLEAAEEAMSRRGAAEAVDLYEKALPLVHDKLQRGEVLCKLGTAYWWSAKPLLAARSLGDGLGLLEGEVPAPDIVESRLTLGRVLEELQRTDEAADQYEVAKEAIGSQSSRAAAEVRVRLADVHLKRLEAGTCLLLAEDAVRIASEGGHDDVRLEAQLFVGVATAATGGVAEGLDILEHSYQEARRRMLDTVAAEALARSIIILHWSGRGPESQVLAGEMATLDAGPWYEYAARYWKYYMEGYCGDLGWAASGLEELRDAAQESGMQRWASHAEDELANMYVDLDRLDDAAAILPAGHAGLSRFEQLVSSYTRMRLAVAQGTPEAEIEAVRFLEALGPISPRYVLTVEAAVELALASGERAAAEAVIANATAQGGYSDSPWFSRARARLASSTGDDTAAVDLCEVALGVFHNGGYPVEEARTLLLLGELHTRLDQRDRAVARLNEAVGVAATCSALRVARLAREALARLGETSSAADAPEPSRVPRVSQPLGEQFVTVLFADVRGFTQMTARETPGEMSVRMGAFYRWARREVERREGIVDEFRGDSVMATFNADGRSLEHGRNAVEAAVALRDKAALMNLALGIGISVGPAVVGSEEKGGLTVIGEVANRAARLQAEAAGGEILLDPEAYRRALDWLRNEGHTTTSRVLALKGIDEPVRAEVISDARRRHLEG